MGGMTTPGPVIAVVDDDEAIRVALSSLLRSEGYEVRLFPGAEAFLADLAQARPDCLLTDMQMPGMTGVELQRALRSRMPDLPVIVITAFPEDSIRDQALEAGARHFVTKPFAAKTILHCLSDALRGG